MGALCTARQVAERNLRRKALRRKAPRRKAGAVRNACRLRAAGGNAVFAGRLEAGTAMAGDARLRRRVARQGEGCCGLKLGTRSRRCRPQAALLLTKPWRLALLLCDASSGRSDRACGRSRQRRQDPGAGRAPALTERLPAAACSRVRPSLRTWLWKQQCWRARSTLNVLGGQWPASVPSCGAGRAAVAPAVCGRVRPGSGGGSLRVRHRP